MMCRTTALRSYKNPPPSRAARAHNSRPPLGPDDVPHARPRLVQAPPAVACRASTQLGLLAAERVADLVAELRRERLGRHALEVDRVARAHDPRDLERLVAQVEQREEVA